MASGYEPYIWAYFLEKFGGNEYGVAGLMGNLRHESGCYPNRLQGDNPYSNRSVEYTAKVDSGAISRYDFIYNGPGGNGYGLAQWTYKPRKRQYYDYWKQYGYPSIGDINLGCDFLWWELSTKGEYANVLETLKSAKTVKEASDIVLMEFEKPRNAASKKSARAASSQEYYDQFHGTTVDPSLPDQPGDDNTEYPTEPAKQLNLMMIILSSRRRRGRVV